MVARKSGMATGTEVARISVKVSPDTTKFAGELKEKLEAIEKALKKDGLTVKADDADTSGAEKKVDQAKERMSRKKVAIKTEVKKIDLSQISKDISRNLSNPLDQFNKFDVNNKIFWNPQEGKEATQVAIDNYKRIQQEAANTAKIIKQEAEKSAKALAAQNKAEVDATLKRLNKRRGDMLAQNDIYLAFDAALVAAKDIEYRLNRVWNPKNIKPWHPEVIRAKLGLGKPLEIGLSFGKGDKGESLLPGLPSGKAPKLHIPFMGSVGPGGIAGIAGLAALSLPLIESAIGAITVALLALPGILATVLIPIGAMALGMDGFKKAAETAKPAFEDLKNKMNEVSQTSFTPMFQRLSDEVIPRLKASLPGVTQGLAELAQGPLDALKGAAGDQMQASIGRIGTFLGSLRPAAEQATSGVSGLIDQFTQNLPQISGWVNDLATRFNNWVAEISADGSLQSAFQQIGDVIDHVVDALGSIGSDALDFVKDPGNMQMVKDLIDGIATGMHSLKEAAEGVAALWPTIKDMGTVLNIGQNVLQGDLSGAWNAFKGSDLGQRNGFGDGGTKAQIDGVTTSIQAAGAAADANKPKIEAFLGGGADGNNFGATTGSSAYQAAKVPTPAAPAMPEVIPPPDTAQADAKINEYKAKIQGLSTTQVPAPNLSQFNAELTKLPESASAAMQGVAEAVNAGGQAAAGNILLVGQQMVANLSTFTGLFQIAGQQMMLGMANGITVGTAWVVAAARSAAAAAYTAAKQELNINSPSKKFIELGKSTGEGMGVGMEKGFAPVLAQAKDLSGKIAAAFENGSDPTGFLTGFTDKETSRMEKVLSFQGKVLTRQAKELDRRAKATGDESLKAKADMIRAQVDELANQREALDLAQEYADLQNPNGDSDWKGPIAKLMNSAAQMPMDFMSATADQAMQDLGISGGGALGALKDYGAQLGSQYIFNVGNMEDALTAKERQQNREAVGVVGR